MNPITPDVLVISAIVIFSIITLIIGISILLKLRRVGLEHDRHLRELQQWSDRQQRIRQQAESIEDRIRNNSKSAIMNK